jgi:hypothetical protein
MSELAYLQAFIDWLGKQGIVTEPQLAQFHNELKHKAEAEKIVNDMFKGMF